MSLKKTFIGLIISITALISQFAYSETDSSFGDVIISDFSWSKEETGVQIINSVATPQLSGLWCEYSQSAYCGVTILFFIGNSGETVALNTTINDSRYYTNLQAVSHINAFAGRFFSYPSGVTKNNITRLCVYKAIAQSLDFLGIQIMRGTCVGGGIPPIPKPASCTLEMDDQVMDFGNITAASFVTTAAGMPPDGVSEMQRNLTVSCSDSQASSVNLAITGGTTSGNILVSSEPNIGFKISFGENSPTVNPVTPNNSTSVFPLSLDSTGIGQTVIRGIPVSINKATKPAAGEFSAVATIQAYWD